MGRTWAFVPVRRSEPPPVRFQEGDVITCLNGKFIATDEQRQQITDLLERVCGSSDRPQVWQLQRLLDEGYIRVDDVAKFTDHRKLDITIL